MKKTLLIIMILLLNACYSDASQPSPPLTEVTLLRDMPAEDEFLEDMKSRSLSRRIYAISSEEMNQLQAINEHYQRLFMYHFDMNVANSNQAPFAWDSYAYPLEEEIKQAYKKYNTIIEPVKKQVKQELLTEVEEIQAQIATKEKERDIKKQTPPKNNSIFASKPGWEETIEIDNLKERIKENKQNEYFVIHRRVLEILEDKNIDLKEVEFALRDIIMESLQKEIFSKILLNKIESPTPSFETLTLPTEQDYYLIYHEAGDFEEVVIVNMKELRKTLKNQWVGKNISMTKLQDYGVLNFQYKSFYYGNLDFITTINGLLTHRSL